MEGELFVIYCLKEKNLFSILKKEKLKKNNCFLALSNL